MHAGDVNMMLFAIEAGVADPLSDVLKAVQIGFYCFGMMATVLTVTIGVLTYRAAKRGWLTPVNTEYQKRVMDRLAKLSEDLYSETDQRSQNYWYDKIDVVHAVDLVDEQYQERRFEVGSEHSDNWLTTLPVLPYIFELENQLRMIYSDPFIPEDIRNPLLDLLKRRIAALGNVYDKELKLYAADLAKGNRIPGSGEENSEHVLAMIYEGLDRTDCYIERFAIEVSEIRKLIQNYFRAFDPHGGGYRQSRT